MKRFSVQDIITRVRRRLFQPDPNNSNFSDAELIDWINDVKDDLFSRIGLDAREKTIVADGVAEDFVLTEDVNVLEAVSIDNHRVNWINLEQKFDAGPIPFIFAGQILRPSDGVFFRDNTLTVRPVVQAGKEIIVHLRAIPRDFVTATEQITGPGRIRRAFVFGVCAEARMKLAADANIASAADWLTRYEREAKLLRGEFKIADQPREQVVAEVY